MAQFEQSRAIHISDAMRQQAATIFSSKRIDPDEMAATMRWASDKAGQVIDPHTAIGLAAARETDLPKDVSVVTLATAHPAKFPDAVSRITGKNAPLPHRLADLYSREERYVELPASRQTIQAYIDAGFQL